MTVKNKKLKSIVMWVFVIAMYARSLISSYTAGRQHLFYFLLAGIPFFFLCWGLNDLLSGKDIRDISKNLTVTEREELTRLATSRGVRIGILAAPFILVCGFLYAFLGPRAILSCLILFGLLMVIAVPNMISHHKKMKAFMYSTEYAKKQEYGRRSA
jgi:hypothetical protein